MSARRSRFERRDMMSGYRIQKAREERFVKSLTEAREVLDKVIEKAERGSALTLDTLEDFGEQMAKVYGQAKEAKAETFSKRLDEMQEMARDLYYDILPEVAVYASGYREFDDLEEAAVNGGDKVAVWVEDC